MVTRKTIVEEGIYHITQRAPGKELLFIEENDYLRFLKLLKKASREFFLDIFCFAILPNHLHILVRINSPNLDKAMKFIFQSYAISFNKKYERKGHVFCGVYRASLCRDDSYLLTASLYIHLNPYKAGLTQSPFKYRWFSLEPYIESVESTFLKPQLILSMLDDKDLTNACNIYKRLLKESVDLRYENCLEDYEAVRKFTHSFICWFKNNFSLFSSKTKKILNDYLELEEKIDKFKLNKRLKPEDAEALIYLIEQLRTRGYSIPEIAEKLNKSRQAIYRLMRQYRFKRYCKV